MQPGLETSAHFLFDAGMTYGVALRQVVGVTARQAPTRLSGMPVHVPGVAYLRGSIYVLVDLSMRASRRPLPDAPHVVLVQEGALRLALLATHIHGLPSVAEEPFSDAYTWLDEALGGLLFPSTLQEAC